MLNELIMFWVNYLFKVTAHLTREKVDSLIKHYKVKTFDL